MRPVEFDRFIKSNGFAFEREGGKHRIYALQGHTVVVPRGKSIKTGTLSVIKRKIKEIVQAVEAKSEAALQVIEIPESGCDPAFVKGENTTLLPQDKFEMYAAVIEFCQSKADEDVRYTLRELLLFLDYQLLAFNGLVATAIEKQDLDVLFQLRDALELVQIHSYQINDAILDFENMTAPTEASAQEDIQETPPEPVRFITSARKVASPVIPIQPVIASPSIVASVRAEVAQVVQPAPSPVAVKPEPLPEPAPAPVLRKGLSVRQIAVAKILAIFGELPDDDTGPVLKQVTDFLVL